MILMTCLQQTTRDYKCYSGSVISRSGFFLTEDEVRLTTRHSLCTPFSGLGAWQRVRGQGPL